MNILRKQFVNGASVKMLACLCCIFAVGLLILTSVPAQAQQQVPQAIQDQLNAATAANIAQIAADLAKSNPELAAAIAAAAAKLQPGAAGDIAVKVAQAVPTQSAADIAQAVVNEVPDQVDAVNTAMSDSVPNWTNVTATQPTTTTGTDATVTTSTSSTTSTTETTTTSASPSSELLNRLASARGL